MALGPTHSAVVVEAGQVYTFGRNSEGQLCAGHCLPRNTPVQVKGLQTKPTVGASWMVNLVIVLLVVSISFVYVTDRLLTAGRLVSGPTRL